MEKIKKLKDYSFLIEPKPKSRKKCAVTSHTIPDPDAVACCIGVSYFLGCEIVVHDFLRSDSKRIFQLAREGGLVKMYKVKENLDDYDHVIVVDSLSKQLLPHISNRKVDLVIDHHIVPSHSAMISYKESYIRKATSATELLLDMVDYRDIPPRLAAVFLTGIITDTAYFSQANKETFEKISMLLKISDLSYNELIEILAEPLPFGERKVILEGITSAKIYKLRNDLIVAVSKCKSHESVISSILKNSGADLGIAYVLSREGVRLSSRLATPLKHKINLPNIMEETGKILGGSGGGHALAAGADGPLNDRIDNAIEYVKKKLEEVKF